MNPGQEKFFNFILANVKEDKKSEAEVLLKESFGKQADGTFGPAYLETFIPKMLGLIKEENLMQVKNIMMEFKSRF